MRSDHLAKHVKTHNGTGKKGSSESCSDSEENSQSDLTNSVNSPVGSMNHTPPPQSMSQMDMVSGLQDVKPPGLV